MRADRLPGLRRIPALASRVRPRVVLYQSWGGRLADSPRAIFDELRRRDAAYEHVWVLNDPAAAPDGAAAVRPGGAAYLQQLGRAGHIVSSNVLPGYFRKKPSTTYLQTWHGTPLKRIAFDIEQPAFADRERYFRWLRREVDAWDYLVSPNSFSTAVLRRAFRYEGPILETGYPRNDVLASPDRARVREEVRAELGIADGVRAVLYAPTWRDDRAFTSGVDLAALAERLGDGFVLLLRAHRAVAESAEVARHSHVRNVSGRDDVAGLLLAADVLVTDYSSVMCDFAITERPIVLFTYDLAYYRDELRGLYVDLEAEAPGPLVDTVEELAGALIDADAVRERHSAAYERFRERYCSLEDGRSAERVVDAVFDT
jgi:CDP-glycerol glycerophosphotransferase